MNNGENARPADILLVEDNPADVRLMTEAMKEEKVICNLAVVNDGVEAIAYLRKEGKYEKAIRPDLILLDLNLPKKDGRDMLKEIKTDDHLKAIPVIVLTVSKLEKDVLATYKLYANCNINKPLGLKDFMRVARYIKEFWLTVVQLPSKE